MIRPLHLFPPLHHRKLNIFAVLCCSPNDTAAVDDTYITAQHNKQQTDYEIGSHAGYYRVCVNRAELTTAEPVHRYRGSGGHACLIQSSADLTSSKQAFTGIILLDPILLCVSSLMPGPF